MPRSPLSVLAPMLLAGCIFPVREVSFDDGGIWEFYVYDDPEEVGDYVVLTDATVTVRDDSGATLDAATSQGDGSWLVNVDPGQPVDIIIAAEGRLPTVRRAIGPETTALLAVPMYPRSATEMPGLIDQLAEVDGLDFPDSSGLLSAETGALIVEPLVPEDWIGGEVLVTDTNGSELTAVTLTAFEDGSYAFASNSAVDLVLAPQVPAGIVTLTFQSATGVVTTQEWTIEPGELVDGRYLSLAPEN